MAEAVKRYDRPVKAEFGGEVITIAPLRGLKRIAEFEEAVTEEIQDFKARLESGMISKPSSPEHLFTKAVDVPRLLRLALPDLTDEQLDNSTPKERLGALEDAMLLNGIGHLSVFLAPGTLLEIGLRLRAKSDEILIQEFGSPESSSSS
jgi:hypothetical protein